MKLLRSKSVAAQRKALGLALTRVRKVSAEITELSRRDWKGGEMPIAREVNTARDDLSAAVDHLRAAEEHLATLERMAVAKGK